jgi:hypothetical protein
MRDATEGWAKSQSYNLYRKINLFKPQMNADERRYRSAFIRVHLRLKKPGLPLFGACILQIARCSKDV